MKNKRTQLPIILGLLTLLFAVPLSVLLTSQKNVGETRTKAAKENVILSFFPQNPPALALGQRIQLNILIDTKGESLNALDLMLSFDPSKLYILDADIVPGKIFSSYPGLFVDKETNTIAIGADGTYKGSGILATINLTAIGKGQTNVSFQKVFSQNQTFTTSPVTINIQ